jgi:hypothetical protein
VVAFTLPWGPDCFFWARVRRWGGGKQGSQGGGTDCVQGVAFDAFEIAGHVAVDGRFEGHASLEVAFVGGVVGDLGDLGDQGVHLCEQGVCDPRGIVLDLVVPGPEGTRAVQVGELA